MSSVLRLFKIGAPVPNVRVHQLDASLLDAELVDLLKNQLFKGFTNFHPEFRDKWESELVLALKVILFKLTVWDHAITYGGKLQNLKFIDSRHSSKLQIQPSVVQKLGYGIMVVGGGYLWSKIEGYLLARSEDDVATDGTSVRGASAARGALKIANFASLLYSAATLGNFVAFLYTGRYATVIMRLLRIRLVPSQRTSSRQVSYEFQNRQLVWNAFTEFLIFILPLLQLPKLKRRIERKLQSMNVTRVGNVEEASEGELAHLPQKTCAICFRDEEEQEGGGGASHYSTDVTNPYQADCGHVYCYVCLVTKLAQGDGDGWNCYRCANQVHKMKPWVDVDEAAVVGAAEMHEKVDVIEHAEANEQEEDDYDDDEDENSNFQLMKD